MAQEDYEKGCSRWNSHLLFRDSVLKSVLLFQATSFLKAFRRRVEIHQRGSFPKDYLVILNRIEDFTAGRLSRRNFRFLKEELQLLLEAFNDLSDALNFYMSVVAPKRMKYLAFKDLLTDAYNRNFLYDYVKLLKVSQDQFPVGVIFVDMDNLKVINDKLGHKMGDFYLIKISEALKNSVRRSDKVFRIGGDEFVVLISNGDENVLKRVIERIKRQINLINEVEELNPPLSVSIGYSVWKSPDVPFDKVLEEADINMYRSKKEG